jgi:AcrR family transcriptional regulator
MSAEKKQVPSVWTRPQRRVREQPALSREQIVAEALALLDDAGIEALSMRKLGTRLNAGATSLYTHVANKDELIELVVDAVYGEIEVPSGGGAGGDAGAWRDAAGLSAYSLRAMVLRHPWVASVLGQVGLSGLGPNVMRMSERLQVLFEGAGLAPEEAGLAISALTSYVVGMAISEGAYLSMIARSGMTEREFVQSVVPAEETAVLADPAKAREVKFDYGLRLVLDGLEGRVSPRR